MRLTAILCCSGLLAGLTVSTGASALTVNTTTNGASLLGALVPDTSQFTNITAAYTAGNSAQVGTYSGFNSGPVTMNNGVVLSTGQAAETTAAFHSNNNSPDMDFGGPSTPEIDTYAPTHVTNWSSSNDAARLTLAFTLATSAAIRFSFSFGSVEFPTFTNSYTDAFYAFLDGQQISFDKNGVPVQVGTSFSNTLTTADTNTAFSNPHGLVANLTTTSGTLLAGAHELSFEVADTNDGDLDSAVFLTGFGTTTNAGGPTTGPVSAVPLPPSLPMFGLAILVLGGIGYRFRRVDRTSEIASAA